MNFPLFHSQECLPRTMHSAGLEGQSFCHHVLCRRSQQPSPTYAPVKLTKNRQRLDTLLGETRVDKGMLLLLSVCSSHKNTLYLCIRVVFVLGGGSGGFVQRSSPFFIPNLIPGSTTLTCPWSMLTHSRDLSHGSNTGSIAMI